MKSKTALKGISIG